jgi:hypothetical protein
MYLQVDVVFRHRDFSCCLKDPGNGASRDVEHVNNFFWLNACKRNSRI